MIGDVGAQSYGSTSTEERGARDYYKHFSKSFGIFAFSFNSSVDVAFIV